MTAAHSLRCLWLARTLPFPLDSGDRIYSARLAGALAEAGASVHFFGHAARRDAVPPGHAAVRWHGIGGGPHPTWRGLASLQPLNGAVHATPAYRKRLASVLTQAWDAVVIDHYGMAWALPAVLQHARRRTKPPVLVHVAHNHESTLWQGLVRQFSGSSVRRLGAWLNLLKIRRIERRLAGAADLLCCIAEEDAQAFERDRGGRRTIVLTPGYSGLRMPERTLSAQVPRRALMVGSFRWVAKQENLKALVRHADGPFTAHGIGLDVVGDMPDALRAQLAGHASVRLHGFVDDIAPLLRQARLAIVPEAIGGGFKLKFLDYVFGRMPVVTLDVAAAGLPAAMRDAMLTCADLPALVRQVVASMDDLPLLDRLQRQAHASAAPLFHWGDRGVALRNAIEELSSAPAAAAQGLRIDAAGVHV
ncbi:MAG: glycosyltransferase [Burkholderiales bacterium]|nr:glycosyltransferase [Burkholderiales bacterium]